MTRGLGLGRGRLILISLILVLGAFWIGARYGPRQPEDVEARRNAEGSGAPGSRAQAS